MSNKKIYKTILFDMDGTISDSFEGISKCVAYALSKFGITVTDLDSLKRFIGPPLKQSFVKFYGFSELMALTAVDYYRQRYEEIGIDSSSIYEGIPELLSLLKKKDVTVAVASSKYSLFIDRILNKHNLSGYFDFVGGSDPNLHRFDKDEVIGFVLDNLNLTDKSSVLMVGDRCFDLDSAEKLGIDAVGVLYGYGSLKELNNCKSLKLINTVDELKSFLDTNT